MKQFTKALMLAAICGHVFSFSPYQVLAGDGGVLDDVYTVEADISNGDDEGSYVSDSIEQSEAYNGNVSQVSESPQQEDWDNVTSGDWEEQGEQADDAVPNNGTVQEVISDEITDNVEISENKETKEDIYKESPEVSSDFASNVDEVVADTGNNVVNEIGDVNNDGTLDALDCALLQEFIQGKQDAINKDKADFNGDGQISMFDVYALLNLIKSEGKGSGDVNGDGKINNYDIQAITAYMANQTTAVNRQNADLNGDGEINGKDLTILREVVKVRMH